MEFKFIECKNSPDNIWIICSEENKHSSFLISKKDLINFLSNKEDFENVDYDMPGLGAIGLSD